MKMTNIGELRPILDSELELMRVWRNHPDIRTNMYTRHEISEEEHRNWWDKIRGDDSKIYFMYQYQEKPQGIVGISDIDKINGNAVWAFYAAPDASKGTGSRMEMLALDYVFYELKLNKLSCEVLAFNTPVIKMHLKFGFQQEGVFRQQYLVDDKFVDVYRLGILSSEWQANRDQMKSRIEKFSR